MSHATYDLYDLRFSLKFGQFGNGRCFLCKAPFIPPSGYSVNVEYLNDGCDGDVCDACSRKFVPELVFVRGFATELFHFHRSLAEPLRKPAETTLPGPAAADVSLTADPH
jgi:hypothetical protein